MDPKKQKSCDNTPGGYSINMPSIQFINHSSVLIKDKDTRILCDPWYKGLAFQDGWAFAS